jgi:hypothetical protein
VPLYSLKLSTYDPEIIDAYERLRKSRKQATFTHEAIKQFLSTDRGKQVLTIMEGSAPCPQTIHAPYVTSSKNSELAGERVVLNSVTLPPQSASTSVLESILE